MDKKYYVAPSAKVVKMELQRNLLAGSGEEEGYNEDIDAADIESVKKNNFDNDWK